MRTGSKRLISLVALASSALLVVTACSSKSSTTSTGPQYSPGYSECQTKPDDCNSGPRKSGGSIVVALGKVIPEFNVNSSDGNLVEAVEVMNLIQPTVTWFLPSGKIMFNKDLLVADPTVTSTSPQTVVYKIKPEAKWGDGTPINVDDFVYAWKTQNGADKNITPASTTGYEDITDITGSDGGKTVTVKFKDPYPDWAGLFTGLFPAHVVAKGQDITTNTGLEAAWKANSDQPTWTAGPYKISAFSKDTQIELVPNPNWYGADKPTLDKVTFKFITDPSQQLPALQNKEIQALNVQPDASLYKSLQGMTSQGVQYEVSAGFSWEHIDVNTKNKWLSDVNLRTAIFDTIDRQTLIDKAVKSYFPSAKPLGSHNFVATESNYKDILTQVAPDQGNGKAEAAKAALTAGGYTNVNGQLKDKTGAAVGPITLVHTGTAARAAISLVVADELKAIGITVQDKVTDDLSGSLSDENFDLILFGWSASPLKSANVDLWETGGGNNFTQWGDPQADTLLKQSATELDAKKQADEQNQADEIITKAAVVLPLWQKPNLQVATSDYVNIRDNNAGSYFTYNSQQWGLKATSS
jgi:peptide/nickel transport system substrate-binding protein